MSRPTYRKFGASRSFFARCAIPLMFTAKCIGKAKSEEGAAIPHLAKNQQMWGTRHWSGNPRVPSAAYEGWCMLVRIQDSVVKVVVSVDRTRFGGPGLPRAPRSLEINK